MVLINQCSIVHVSPVCNLVCPSNSNMDKFVALEMESEKDDNQAASELAHFNNYQQVLRRKVTSSAHSRASVWF